MAQFAQVMNIKVNPETLQQLTKVLLPAGILGEAEKPPEPQRPPQPGGAPRTPPPPASSKPEGEPAPASTAAAQSAFTVLLAQLLKVQQTQRKDPASGSEAGDSAAPRPAGTGAPESFSEPQPPPEPSPVSPVSEGDAAAAPPPCEDLDYRQAPDARQASDSSSGGKAVLSNNGVDVGVAPEPDYPPPLPPPQPPPPEGPGYGSDYSRDGGFAPLPPPFPSAGYPGEGFGASYLGGMLGGGLPSHSLREVFSSSAPPSSSSSARPHTPGYQEPYSHSGAGAGGGGGSGLVFSGDKDHRFEYNHSPLPVEGLPHPTSIHAYNHSLNRQDSAPPPLPPLPGQGPGVPPFPPGFMPHMNNAALRGRGLPF
ncbi:hypothetical protein AGOR_G00177050 [Albula goreensis]|uniref:Uncharacterized protein n=1 Tax=Albula goreensis TaxID=1534307 RepID=A0A8T3D0S4_9TELE|nr:hypothetical protein AGOR_G00177050 [Albula goreensis]